MNRAKDAIVIGSFIVVSSNIVVVIQHITSLSVMKNLTYIQELEMNIHFDWH